MDNRLKQLFTIEKDKSFILNKGYYAEIRISKDYFSTGVSRIEGNMVETFGILDIYVWQENSTNEYPIEKSIVIKLRLPTEIKTLPHRIDTSNNYMTVLEYVSGDKVIISTLVEKSSGIVSEYVRLLLEGKLPDDIDYKEIMDYWLKSSEINESQLITNILFSELLIMQVSRDPSNPVRLFREYLRDNKKASLNDRKLVKMENIPSLISQFSALTSGDPKRGITSSIGAVKTGEMELKESDIEKAIK